MSNSIHKVPPHSEEAEQSFLGALMIDEDAMIKVVDMVTPDDFYFEKHRLVFEVMVEMFTKHEPIDILSIGNRLDELDKLKNVGGRSFIAELTNVVPTSSNVQHYGSIVAKKSTLRLLIQAASDITKLGFDESNDDLALVLDEAEQKMFGVSKQHLKSSFVPIRNVLSDTFDRIHKLHEEKGKLRGVPTGYTQLDNLLAGFQASDLVILAARPSVGKTAFALSLMLHAAVKHKIPVGLFSLEMSKEQLVDRLICAEGDIDLWKLLTGGLSDTSDDFQRMGKALGTLSEAPIYIDDSASANIMEIRAKCRRLKSEHGLGMIIIDYLQLKESRGKENRVKEVSEISRGLKQIARELEIPILALSQLSRTVEASKPAIPKLSHLRESGSIEQDADVVMFIYRKAVDKNYQPDELTPEDKTIAEIHISKHRNGPTGIVKLFFDGARATFRNLERRRVAPPEQVPKVIQTPPLAKN